MPRLSSSPQKKYESVTNSLNKDLGAGSARVGSETLPYEFVTSGILGLDLALGGGYARGHNYGVFGPRDIGKSTIIGFSAIREAQRRGENCAIVAVEPGFDPEWARSHGVDPDDVFIVEPDTGEQAFEALYKIVKWDEPKFDLIIFDSIGALLAETEISGKTGNDGKMKAGGQAGLITWGTKRILTPTSKRRQIVIYLNQVRDNMASTMGGFKQPGGHAVEHGEAAIIQLKRGPDRYTTKEYGSEVQHGQQILAIIERNKTHQGSRQRALFDFYNKQVEGEPFGVDTVKDILTTGERMGLVRRGGAYYTLGTDEEGLRFMGKVAVAEHLAANPDFEAQFRARIQQAIIERRPKK